MQCSARQKLDDWRTKEEVSSIEIRMRSIMTSFNEMAEKKLSEACQNCRSRYFPRFDISAFFKSNFLILRSLEKKWEITLERKYMLLLTSITTYLTSI